MPGVVMRDVVIDSYEPIQQWHSLIRVDQSSHGALLENVVISNSKSDVNQLIEADKTSQTLTLRNVEFLNCSAKRLWHLSASNVMIDGVTIEDSAGEARLIEVDDETELIMRNARFTNCWLWGIADYALYLIPLPSDRNTTLTNVTIETTSPSTTERARNSYDNALRLDAERVVTVIVDDLTLRGHATFDMLALNSAAEPSTLRMSNVHLDNVDDNDQVIDVTKVDTVSIDTLTVTNTRSTAALRTEQCK